ncbi:MAG: hypothetical protein HKN20_04925, partial [Gemmatimonadetes bacterium]|nr:hypothetical protein [Gemmatimonadota bacterium]
MFTRHSLRALALALAVVLPAGAHALDGPITGARHPSISPNGSEIAFSYMGDLWVVPAAGGEAERVTVHEAYDQAPLWSPDGARLAFTSDRHGNDDVFVISRAGGRPDRKTFHSGSDLALGWTPDGKSVLFLSTRDSRWRYIFRTDDDAVHPQALVEEVGQNAAVSPDGRWIAWTRGYTPWWRKHYRGSASRDIMLRSWDGGDHVLATDWHGDDDFPMWSADGKSLYFVSEREDSVANIWQAVIDRSADPPKMSGAPKQLTKHENFSIEYASISRDGKTIVYERAGKLWTLATDGSASRPIEVAVRSDDKWNLVENHTDTKGATEFAFSPDESQVAFVVHGEVFAMDLEDGEGTDRIRRLTNTPARERQVAWDTDGQSLLYVSDATGNTDIYRVESADLDEKRLSHSRKTRVTALTKTPENDYAPVPSPDGEKIVFRRGPNKAWTMKRDGSQQKVLIDKADVVFTRWSPDSKWIAVSRSNLGSLEDVEIISADGGTLHNVSRSPLDDYSPFWTEDGRRLAFASRDDYGNMWLRYVNLTKAEELMTENERKERAKAEEESKGREKDDKADKDKKDKAPPVVKIDFDGLHDRVHDVTRLSGGYNTFTVTGDGAHYAVVSNQLGGNDIWLVNEKGDKLEKAADGGTGQLAFSKSGDALLYLSGGGQIKRLALKDGKVDGGAKTVAFEAKYTVDLAAEAEQKFEEAWTLIQDGFYDEDFHGADWAALKEVYRPRALAAYTPEEWRDVVLEMIGELSASHLGVYLPGSGDDATADAGIMLDNNYKGPGARIAKVYRDGPGMREEVALRPGEYILTVDGREVGGDTPYYALWNRLAGEKIDIEVAGDPAGRARRTVTLTAISQGARRNLLYENWVTDNREYVEKLSDGRVGYLHMRAMGGGDIKKFEKELWAEAGDKDALVLDIRFNNGGSVHDQVITILQRRAYGINKSRDREDSYN